MDVNEKIKEIKQSFRQMMDGATAQSMRDKGLNYHLNWGATLPRLREMADEIKQSLVTSQLSPVPSQLSPVTCQLSPVPSHLSPAASLAIALWKENVRECKILATMLMPPEEVLPEVIDIWMEQTDSIELAEQAAFNLYQHLPYAPEKAYQWMASSEVIPQICGFHVMSRLFMKGQEPNERGINEFIDQALAAMQSPNITLRKAAYQSIRHFADLGLLYERLANAALRRNGFD